MLVYPFCENKINVERIIPHFESSVCHIVLVIFREWNVSLCTWVGINNDILEGLSVAYEEFNCQGDTLQFKENINNQIVEYVN